MHVQYVQKNLNNYYPNTTLLPYSATHPYLTLHSTVPCYVYMYLITLPPCYPTTPSPNMYLPYYPSTLPCYPATLPY